MPKASIVFVKRDAIRGNPRIPPVNYSNRFSDNGPMLSEIQKVLDVIGGAERDRTVDLLNAIQALSQLSYSPTGRTLNANLKNLPQSTCRRP
jgi:hypothetical protein